MDFRTPQEYIVAMEASMKWILSVVAATTALALAPAAQADVAYRWVDADGEFQYSPIPPKDPEQSYVMLRDGVVVERFEASEQAKAEERAREAANRAAESERKADALLMVQFRNEDAIEEAMEAELDTLRYDFKLLDGTYRSLRQSLFEKIGQAADLQRAGLTVTSEEREEIEGLRNRMEANRRAREELRQRERSIRDDYADKKQRYMALKAGTTAS